MKHIIGFVFGIFVGWVVWLSTGQTGLGIGVAAVLALLFSCSMGVMAIRKYS